VVGKAVGIVVVGAAVGVTVGFKVSKLNAPKKARWDVARFKVVPPPYPTVPPYCRVTLPLTTVEVVVTGGVLI